MSSRLTIQPAADVSASIRPPGSKSITNRALICAALGSQTTQLHGCLQSDDTQVMVESLQRVGVKIQSSDDGKELTVHGCNGRFPIDQADLFVGNSGTSMRFLTAALTVGNGTYRLDGVPRMRQRPIGHLLGALNDLGCDAQGDSQSGFPPVVVHARGIEGGTAEIPGDISSQFLSGLLMAAPYARNDVTLEVVDQLVSIPYVHMTLAVMKSFGVEAQVDENLSRFQIAGRQAYGGGENYQVEPDASAASYFWGAAAITGGTVEVEGLSFRALQGDVQFCRCLAQMGCDVEETEAGIRVRGTDQLRGIDVDMNPISDTVQTLAAVALFAAGPTIIRGVAHIRHKETDRIGDLARELRRLGAQVDEMADGLRITPGPLRAAEVQTYDDHRMAMSLALVGLRHPGVTILDPGCTSKTYPQFFDDLDRICGR